MDRGFGEHALDLHRAARVLLDQAQARDVRRRLHLIPDRRLADLQVRRARALPPRAARLRALSRRDTDLLRARRARRLRHGHADDRALLARHAAAWWRGAGEDRAIA